VAESKALLEWRSKQKRGTIMPPVEFEKRVREAMRKYKFSRKRAMRYVGKIYWNMAEAKFEKSHTAEAIKKNMEKR